MVLMMPQHSSEWESQLVRERMWRSLLVTSSFLVSYKDRDRNSTLALPFVTSNKISFFFITTAGTPLPQVFYFLQLASPSLRVQWHLVPFQSSQMPCVCVTSILKRLARLYEKGNNDAQESDFSVH